MLPLIDRRRAGILPLMLAVALSACGDSRSTTVTPPPAPAATLPPFTQISAGGSHTCALSSAAELYCWGRGGAGALGVDSLASFVVPAQVLGGGFTFAGVSAGAAHTCAVTPAGEAYCWGQGDRGQLGTGAKTGSRVPVLVAGAQLFSMVAAGGEHTCGVLRTGRAACWGRNADAELGLGANGADVAVPALVADTTTYTAVTTGRHHSCGLSARGTVRCWGWNPYGQLGVDSRFGLGAPENVHRGLTFQQVSAGSDFTCGLTTAGAAYCWGRNEFSQLGNGTSVDTAGPVAVSGGQSFASLSAGGAHVCALTAGGDAYCWGNNADGQLGNGTSLGVQSVPVAVSGAVKFARITAGLLHTCAVTTEGAAYCWGFGGFGQLGTGRAIDANVPTRVVASR